MQTILHGSVDSRVQGRGFATAKTHISSAALEALPFTIFGGFDRLHMLIGSMLNALNDIGHCTRSVRAQDLDSSDVCLLRNTILLAGDGSRAVSAVAITILIWISRGNSLAPLGTTFEVDVVDIGAGINDVDIDALAAVVRVDIFIKIAKAKSITVRDTS